MSEKHTPGPWRVRHRHYDAGPNEDEIGGLGWELEGPPEPMRGHFALAADTHLVAAAPDLLEALRSALFWLGKPEEDRLDDAAFQMFCDWARETVSRAEGGDEQ